MAHRLTSHISFRILHSAHAKAADSGTQHCQPDRSEKDDDEEEMLKIMEAGAQHSVESTCHLNCQSCEAGPADIYPAGMPHETYGDGHMLQQDSGPDESGPIATCDLCWFQWLALFQWLMWKVP